VGSVQTDDDTATVWITEEGPVLGGGVDVDERPSPSPREDGVDEDPNSNDDPNSPPPEIDGDNEPSSPPPELDDPPEPAPDPSGAGGYAFVATQDDGSRPVAYDPCQAIPLVVNSSSAPPGAEAILSGAIEAVSDATGLRFTIEGPTDEVPSGSREVILPDLYGDRWAPVLVAWTDPETVPDLSGDVVGAAGSYHTTAPDASERVYVSGIVMLDGPDIVEVLDRPEGRAEAQAIVMHEFGHLVGLDHVDDPTQLMYPRMQEGLVTFQPGDLSGLDQLGRGRCFGDV
jgi:hypothetical protein